jgi:hypothetical protein
MMKDKTVDASVVYGVCSGPLTKLKSLPYPVTMAKNK